MCNDIEIVMDAYNVQNYDRTNFKAVWEMLDTYGMIKTKNVKETIYGPDVSVVKTILDMFRK
jgi:hypothetical protein